MRDYDMRVGDLGVGDVRVSNQAARKGRAEAV
jgi:hypothetical protein